MQHYSGIKSIEFYGFSNHGKGGNSINASINNNEMTFFYYVDGWKIKKIDNLSVELIDNKDVYGKKIKFLINKNATLEGVNIKATWNGK